MTEHQSSRTLVKSAPELWAECSDAASLARHLGAFGEIRITKLEPETAVAWEGTVASGTVRLEPSGWGTRVTLTLTEAAGRVQPDAAAADPDPEIVAELVDAREPADAREPVGAPESVEPAPAVAGPAPRPGLFARWRLSRRRRQVVAPEPGVVDPEPAEPVAESPPEPVAPPEPGASPEPVAEPQPPAATGEEALVAALDSLGMAHHRPYSRA